MHRSTEHTTKSEVCQHVVFELMHTGSVRRLAVVVAQQMKRAVNRVQNNFRQHAVATPPGLALRRLHRQDDLPVEIVGNASTVVGTTDA